MRSKQNLWTQAPNVLRISVGHGAKGMTDDRGSRDRLSRRCSRTPECFEEVVVELGKIVETRQVVQFRKDLKVQCRRVIENISVFGVFRVLCHTVTILHRPEPFQRAGHADPLGAAHCRNAVLAFQQVLL